MPAWRLLVLAPMDSKLIPREEALRRRLPGAQHVRSGHRIYIDEQSAICGALELLRYAHLTFLDAFCIRHAAELQAKTDSRRVHHLWSVQTRRSALDNFKIGTAIELALKAKLLGGGYLVHQIDPDNPDTAVLAAAQANQPILVSEFRKCVGFVFDTIKTDPCYLPGLKSKSLLFDWLLDVKEYRDICDLKGRDHQIAKVFKDKRNMIHLPLGEHDKAEKHFGSKPSFKDIFGFMNRRIDKYADHLAKSINDHNTRRIIRDGVTEKLTE